MVYSLLAQEILHCRLPRKHQERSNRKSQSLFLCKGCGYSLNADLNACYNIRDRYKTSLADFGIPLHNGYRFSLLEARDKPPNLFVGYVTIAVA